MQIEIISLRCRCNSSAFAGSVTQIFSVRTDLSTRNPIFTYSYSIMTVVESSLPEFLNKSFFEEALRNGFNNPDIILYEWSVTMGSKSGDNYCSEIYRANIVYGHSGARGINISLIVKAMPYQPHRGPILEDLNVFEKEVFMYTEIMPRIAELLGDEFMCAK